MKTEEASCNGDNLALIFGSLLLRLWLGMRALQTGIEKFAGNRVENEPVRAGGVDPGLESVSSSKFYAIENYQGVPEALMGRFQKEPLMPGFGLPLYDKLLGVALLGLGAAILMGFAYRCSLFALGLLYISLTWGLILIKEDAGVAWLGTHMILIVMALALAQHNRLAILKKW